MLPMLDDRPAVLPFMVVTTPFTLLSRVCTAATFVPTVFSVVCIVFSVVFMAVMLTWPTPNSAVALRPAASVAVTV